MTSANFGCHQLKGGQSALVKNLPLPYDLTGKHQRAAVINTT